MGEDMMKNVMKKVTLAALVAGTLTSVLTFKTTYADTKEDIVENYNSIKAQVEEKSNIIEKSGVSLEDISEEDMREIQNLKSEMGNLIKENPEAFEGIIVTDRDKELNLNSNLKTTDEENGIQTMAAYGDVEHWNYYGDIFVSTSRRVNRGMSGHCGLGDYDKGWTIESLPADGVQYRDNYWTWRNDSSAGIYRVDTSVSRAYEKAYDYAKARIGEKYNKTFSPSGEGYYNSEIVYFSWKNGCNIRIRDVNRDGDDYVHPREFMISPKTYKVDWPY